MLYFVEALLLKRNEVIIMYNKAAYKANKLYDKIHTIILSMYYAVAIALPLSFFIACIVKASDIFFNATK